MIEANSASSSANEVSIRTFVAGRVARISRVASIPEPSVSRTSITITSGRVRAASSIASRTVPASDVTTMSFWDSSIARIPSRTISWSSTSITRRGGDAGLIGGILALGEGAGLRQPSQDRIAHPVQEVLECCLGDSGEQGAIDRAADCAQGRLVASADRELASAVFELGHLEVGVERGEHADASGGGPHDGDGRLPRHMDRIADRESDRPGDADLVAEPDLGEQAVATVVGRGRKGRQPRVRRLEHDPLDAVALPGQLDEVASEHAGQCAAVRDDAPGTKVPAAAGPAAPAG